MSEYRTSTLHGHGAEPDNGREERERGFGVVVSRIGHTVIGALSVIARDVGTTCLALALGLVSCGSRAAPLP